VNETGPPCLEGHVGGWAEHCVGVAEGQRLHWHTL
jgi:hypothetical protein